MKPSRSALASSGDVPLAGVRVLDLSRMVAGGVAGMLMADFGADVVKVEQPGTGDPLRQWTCDGQPLWWRVYARNKRFITLNLRRPEGRALLLRLLPRFDILMESFVPGTLDRLGLDWETLHRCHPGLIVVRISGWGQQGPASQRPGFGTLVEAASGFAAMNGEADGPPIVPAFPLADMVAGLYASNAAMLALRHRETRGGGGQQVDVSLFESLFSLLGPLPAEFQTTGRVRRRDGSRSRNAGPRGCYRTRDDQWIALSGSTPKMAERLIEAYGMGALLSDPRFVNNEARVRHAVELDGLVAQAIGARTLAENLALVEAHALTAVPVQTIAEIEQDPHWRARGLLVDVDGDEQPAVRMPVPLPRLSDTPGTIRWAGGALGAHNAAVFMDELGLSDADVEALRADGVI